MLDEASEAFSECGCSTVHWETQVFQFILLSWVSTSAAARTGPKGKAHFGARRNRGTYPARLVIAVLSEFGISEIYVLLFFHYPEERYWLLSFF